MSSRSAYCHPPRADNGNSGLHPILGAWDVQRRELRGGGVGQARQRAPSPMIIGAERVATGPLRASAAAGGMARCAGPAPRRALSHSRNLEPKRATAPRWGGRYPD